jgi:cell division septum initiation protein DivIVA
MADDSLIDQIAERVEQLLVRHDEIMRTNAISREQIAALTRERDNLKSRLMAARARVDALLDRLPVNQNSIGTNDTLSGEESAP